MPFNLQRWFSHQRETKRQDLDEESKTGLLWKYSKPNKDLKTFKIHTCFVLLHVTIAMLWLSTFWAFTPLFSKPADALRPLEFGKRHFFQNL
jgi:hypothetical protein